MQTSRKKVACDGCTRCCQGFQQIMLQAEDDPDQYQTTAAISALNGEPGIALVQRANGDCIYLGDAGCTIYDRAPVLCRSFDCRGMAKLLRSKTTRAEFRRVVRAEKAGVLQRGIDLMRKDTQ